MNAAGSAAHLGLGEPGGEPRRQARLHIPAGARFPHPQQFADLLQREAQAKVRPSAEVMRAGNGRRADLGDEGRPWAEGPRRPLRLPSLPSGMKVAWWGAVVIGFVNGGQ
ncbi:MULTISPECIES: hypothetical protein [Streptomyces]|uniref:hypothetical protein n=1 Tax=Streptomyces TaxID=1883 RepID=UPI001681DB1A|nr:hypothetical protein [Streptomyces venezuelae]